MSRILLLLFTLVISLFSSTLTQWHLYPKKDSVDIMLSFDTPYKGKIKQKKEDFSKIFILENSHIEQNITKEVNTPLLRKMQLISIDNQLYIKLSAQNSIDVDASKTIDNYGLRLRIKPEASPLFKEELVPYQTKKEDHIATAYLKVLFVMALLLGVLYLFKRWLNQRQGMTKGSWLFQNIKKDKKDSIQILQQRPLDMKNRIVHIVYKEKEYLLLLGNSNLLLDTFSHHDSNDFDTVLSENEEALEQFIRQDKSQVDAYKAKLSANDAFHSRS